MFLLYLWTTAPYAAQRAIDGLSAVLGEPHVLHVLRRVAIQLCGCG